MNYTKLGSTDINISKIALGTMTFGEQVDEQTSHDIMSYAMDNGINFFDTAEMYASPTRPTTYGLTEKFIGSWLKKNDRSKLVLGSKVAGPIRGLMSQVTWMREGTGLTKQDIINSCEGSLRRLGTDYIDVYYIHWPERYVPMFGEIYYTPSKDLSTTSIPEQLEAMDILIKQGKIRSVGICNETPYGVSEFLRASEKYNLPKIQAVQNSYSLTNRNYENGLDEMLYKNNIAMMAYSPLGAGVLTGKYDQGFNEGRLARYTDLQKRRWARPLTMEASKLYNDMAREMGTEPAVLALSYCYNKPSITSSILGVTSVEQLSIGLRSCNFGINSDILRRIDEIRWKIRDPSQ